jgi:hypothetical protein
MNYSAIDQTINKKFKACPRVRKTRRRSPPSKTSKARKNSSISAETQKISMKFLNTPIMKILMSDSKPANSSAHARSKKTLTNFGTESLKWLKMKMLESGQEYCTSSATAVQPDSSNRYMRPYKSLIMTKTQTSGEPATRSWPVTKEPVSGTSCERK